MLSDPEPHKLSKLIWQKKKCSNKSWFIYLFFYSVHCFI